MNRRGFLAAILATGVAPAICKAQNLMPVFVRKDSGLLLPELATVTLYDALGHVLATMPLSDELDSRRLQGGAPVLRSGEFHRATIDVPGLGRSELGVRVSSSYLIAGDTMRIKLNPM